jgi:hypothetical protein
LANHGSHESALKLLLVGQKYEEVRQIMETKDIKISEELYNIIQISTIPEDTAKSIHRRLADICFQQGSYSLACKSFTIVSLIYNH